MKKLNKLAAAAIAVMLAGTMAAVSAFAEMYGDYDVQGTVVVDAEGNKTIDGITLEEWIAEHEGQNVYYIEDGVIYDLEQRAVADVDDFTSSEEFESDVSTADSTESTESTESGDIATESTESTESADSSSVEDTSSTESATTSDTSSVESTSSEATTSTTSSTAATTGTTSSTGSAATTSSKTTSSATTKKDDNPKTGTAVGLTVGAVALLGFGALTVSRKSKD